MIMKILVLDTAGSVCAAAIYDQHTDSVLAERSHDIGKGHAEVLLDYVEQCVSEAKIQRKDIGLIAVNSGPGSFTGVRVGISAARGFALALNCPAVAVTGFEALAYEAQLQYPDRPVLVALSAFRDDIYAQAFDRGGQAASAPFAGSLTEVMTLAANLTPDYILSGSATASICALQEGEGRMVAGQAANASVATLARLALAKDTVEAPKPLYMRGPDVKPQTGFALPRR